MVAGAKEQSAEIVHYCLNCGDFFIVTEAKTRIKKLMGFDFFSK